MYNNQQDKYAKQCAEQAASLHPPTIGSCSASRLGGPVQNVNSLTFYSTPPPTPDQLPMSAMAADLVSGLAQLNDLLRSLRAQLFGSEPEAANGAKQPGPDSLNQAVSIATVELGVARSQVERILNRL
jgi:hypothetical protein